MPGDPKECRRHAANCRRLAEEATTPEARKLFTGLAAHWEAIASELESAEVFLQAMNAVQPKKPSRPRKTPGGTRQ